MFVYPIISNPSVPYVILHERRSVSKNKQYDGGLEIIRRMILYIQEHYKERINLNQLCRGRSKQNSMYKALSKICKCDSHRLCKALPHRQEHRAFAEHR